MSDPGSGGYTHSSILNDFLKNAVEPTIKDRIMQKLIPQKDPSNPARYAAICANDTFIKLCYRHFEKTGRIIDWPKLCLRRDNESLNKEDFIAILKIEFSDDNLPEIELNEYYSNLESPEKGCIECSVLMQRYEALSTSLLSPVYNIAKSQYLSVFMDEWRSYIQGAKIDIMRMFYQFDGNKDGVLTLAEFSALIKNIDSKIDQTQAANLFMKVCCYFGTIIN